MPALNKIVVRDIGTVLPIPTDRNVALMTGQVTLSAESLAAGDPATVLIVAGQAFFTGEIKSVGYAQIRSFGRFGPEEIPIGARRRRSRDGAA